MQASSWVAVVCTTGIILGAAYMLYLYWRVVFGELTKADVAAMPDLNRARMWRCWCRSPPRCCGWASIPKASSRRCAATSTTLLARIERAAPAGDAHLAAGKPKAARRKANRARRQRMHE